MYFNINLGQVQLIHIYSSWCLNDGFIVIVKLLHSVFELVLHSRERWEIQDWKATCRHRRTLKKPVPGRVWPVAIHHQFFHSHLVTSYDMLPFLPRLFSLPRFWFLGMSLGDVPPPGEIFFTELGLWSVQLAVRGSDLQKGRARADNF